MLVALVITALLVGIVTQLLFQAQRAEALQARQSPTAKFNALKLAWLREAMEGTMPRPLGDSESLRGDRTEMQAWTTAPIWAEPVGPLRVTWRLRRLGDPSAPAWELWVLHALQPEGQRLLAWSGARGGWRYLDEDGEWHETWPLPPLPGSLKNLGLPRAIELQTGLPGLSVIRWVPQGSAVSLANRRLLEQ